VAYERVHTVTDYYDGPRDGLADYNGEPHRYQRQWDEAADDWAKTFTLTPIDQVTFDLELERWQIWLAWQRAFHAGEVPHDSHPGLGGMNARYDALSELIAARIRGIEPLEARFTASFRAIQAKEAPPGVMRDLEVRWGFAT
jgi:hypothetical protein